MATGPDVSYVDSLCMAAASKACDFKPTMLKRRAVGDYDVLIDMKYCGVCHSDLHSCAGHIKIFGDKNKYPFVPGHELAGVVEKVGSKVTKFKVGEKIGVGCMVDSCLSCKNCLRGEEQKCAKNSTGTYGAHDKHGRAGVFPLGSQTLGGYTDKFVVNENFGIRIPTEFPLECAGPVMCAGITMYDPMRKVIKAGSKLGIVGLGGLGQMGVKIGKALGAEVTVISRSSSKAAFAKSCGADKFVASADEASMASSAKSLDLILNTVPVYHNYAEYNSLLNSAGKQVLLGLHNGIGAAQVVSQITFNKSRVRMSGIGGIKATQEVMDLCAKHDIKPNIKIVDCSEINHVYETLDAAADSQDAIRYVIDIATLNEETAARCTAPPPKLADPVPLTMGGVLKESAWLFFSGNWL